MSTDLRFPNESAEYRQAREELLDAELELRRHVEAVAAQRRALPLGGEVPDDYVFEEWDAATAEVRRVRLSELFADGKDTLLLYSFMFVPGAAGGPIDAPCPSCTSIIDAVDGAVPHLTQQVNFAVSAKAPVERLRAHAGVRGWQHARLLSSRESTYNRDYGAEDAQESQFPLLTVFVRRDGRIHHFWTSELWWAPRDDGQDPRHVDFMWPLWHLLDRGPAGRGGWHPALSYD